MMSDGVRRVRPGILSGITIVEIAAKGPAPFCGMLLADLGADVILVERDSPDDVLGDRSLINRGKRSIALDLKSPAHVETVLVLATQADGLIEGFRPGTMERLGLGPTECQTRNPALVYGRMTGWGQTGPLAGTAGHDLTYLATSGALWYAGQAGESPTPPPTLLGDIGGGALYLAIGMLAGILNARVTGQGTVVDAAILDGSAHMMNLLLALRQVGQFRTRRGQSLLDGPPWSRCYRCADGGWIAVQCLETKFYREMLARLGLCEDPGLTSQHDPKQWPAQARQLETLFATKTRDAWAGLFDGTDACVAPVLSPDEAARQPQNAARGLYLERNGILQTAPAPRFAGEPDWSPPPAPGHGQDGPQILAALGRSFGDST
jgi:crotonobetainyl-CoA:carnitine CoA-transferase CaiB-like acyl-CoA transferase